MPPEDNRGAFPIPAGLEWTPPAADPDRQLKIEAHNERVLASIDALHLGMPLRIVATWQERKAEVEAKAAAEKVVADRAAKTAELEAGVAKLASQIAEAERKRIQPEMRRIAAARMKKGKRELSLPELRVRAHRSVNEQDRKAVQKASK